MPLKFQRKKSLADLTTFKIGGPAKYFVEVKKEKELIEAIDWARKRSLPFFILGGGSNVLFSDRGFSGLVIKMKMENFKISKNKIVAEAGCPLQKLVKEALKNSLLGLEFFVGIPGTLGGAIYQNAGAFGKEMKNIVEKVKVLKITSRGYKIKYLGNEDCKFSYRESIFKKKKNWIILEATLRLKRGSKKTSIEKIKEILKIRKEKQPLEYPSAGSVFKNIPSNKVPQEVKKRFQDKMKNGYLPAGVLIEAVGLKGKRIGGAKISEKHANFIINFQNAKAKEIKKLIEIVKEKIKKEFGVEIKEEIELVGF